MTADLRLGTYNKKSSLLEKLSKNINTLAPQEIISIFRKTAFVKTLSPYPLQTFIIIFNHS